MYRAARNVMQHPQTRRIWRLVRVMQGHTGSYISKEPIVGFSLYRVVRGQGYKGLQGNWAFLAFGGVALNPKPYEDGSPFRRQ